MPDFAVIDLQRAHLGLRARVTTAFVIGALLLSVALSVLSYGITRRYLLREGESSACGGPRGSTTLWR